MLNFQSFQKTLAVEDPITLSTKQTASTAAFPKSSIQQRFDAASESYDEVASIQRECAKTLVEQLTQKWPNFSPKTILDLGTGTGFVSQLLVEKFPHAHFTLNDASSAMLQQACKKLGIREGQIQYKLGRIENTVFDPHELIISNLAFQWVHPLEKVLPRYFHHSNVLCFSGLLDGTFAEWFLLLKQYGIDLPLNIYPSLETMQYFLRDLNPLDFQFFTQKYTLSFPHPKAMMIYLQKLGASHGAASIPFSKLKAVIQSNHSFEVTYHVFFGLLLRRIEME